MTTPVVAPNDLLRIDAAAEIERISNALHEIVLRQFHRKGAVVAVSGGIDSSVVAAVCTRSLGANRVMALLLPEPESSSDSLRLGKLVVEQLGIRYVIEDIGPILEAAGCYRRRDQAIRGIVPEYGNGYKTKIALPNLLDNEQYAVFSLIVQTPSGKSQKIRLPLDAYLSIVAATNFKQRTRKMIEYYYADRYNFAVAGTPNRLEYDQGFFVKNGDGAADFKPIAHLYKSQVYDLAAFLDIPEEIQHRPPTTDTYSLSQSQEEFYFAIPLRTLDVCLFGKDHNVPENEVAELASLTVPQVRRVYDLIEAKRKMARYLHCPPLPVCAIG